MTVIIIILASSQELDPNSEMVERDSKTWGLRVSTATCVVLSTQHLLGPAACLTIENYFLTLLSGSKPSFFGLASLLLLPWLDRGENASLFANV